MKMIQWPIETVDGLKLSSEFRADECLRFHDDGTITSNGGHVDHHEITEGAIALLPEEDREFVQNFLK